MKTSITLAALTLLGHVQAQTVMTAGGTTVASSQNFGCFQCIRQGGRYCSTDTTYARHATIDDTTTTKCVTTATACSSGTAITYDSSQTMELILAQCPTATTVCGSTLQQTFADATVAAVTLTPPADLAQNTGCSYLIKATCGAPLVKRPNFGSNGYLSLIHYTDDTSRITVASNSAGTATEFPAITTSVTDLTAAASCGTSTNCDDKTATNYAYQVPYRKTTAGTVVSTADILQIYNNYIQQKITYLQNVDTAVTNWGLSGEVFSLFDSTSKISYPTYIGTYSGLDWSALTSMGGWGDISIQPMNGAADQYYEYGVYGSVTTDPTSTGATANAYDINTASCANRYALVTMFNTESTAITAANAAITGRASGFYSSLSSFIKPNSPSEFTADAMTKAALSVATVLGLASLM